MVHASMSGHPTFEQAEKVWPPIGESKGGVVIFMPRDVAGEIIFGLPAAGFKVDGKYYEILNGTYCWADYPVGEHTINASGNLWAKKDIVTFAVMAGQTSYIQVSTKGVPQILERERALPTLAVCHHPFKDARPLEQKK